ncbi:beta-lactamase [Botryosphaeria dothidea]|uniref:Beta-lactamase n=1 Tax=Botryosphaeria dothidea TaxID=55169 RepID=A0A8H4IHM1_9PEZI|nr:beta-lactamase [Botryosphaeria dothidea]
MRQESIPFVLCSLLQLFEPALAYPAKGYKVTAKAVGEVNAADFEYYLAANATAHQTHYDDLSAKGYRMTSLSSFGGSSDAEYAAVWVKRSGPSFTAVHNVDASAFKAWIDAHSEGHVPTLIAATGPADSAVFSAVMEAGNTTWTQKCDMTEYSLGGQDQGARAQGQIMTSFRQYGIPGDYRYCAIWHANPVYDKMTSYLSNAAVDGFKSTVETEKSKPYWRPGSISIAEDGSYTSFWTDSSIGGWDLQYDLTAADLDAEISKQKSAGRYIAHLSGGGAGESTRYAAVFASQYIPSTRNWVVKGSATTGFPDSAAAEAKAESLIQDFMKKAGVRQVQLAIAQKGEELLNKAYTWSEPERHITQTNDTFLLASVSKAFCAAAIQTLYDAGKLTPDTKVYPLLGYANPADARQQDITIQQLLDHTAGFKRSVSGDPAYQMREIALAQSNGARPASLKDVVDYMYARPLDYTPGTDYEYGNYNYMLLSYVVEHVAATSYWAFLKPSVLGPDSLDVKRWLTDPATHAADNVVQESAMTGLSALEPSAPDPVAHVYGGDGQYKDATLGTTGLAASASALAKFAHTHAVWGVGGRSPGYRDGTTSGARTYMESRGDGVDWAMTINTRDFPNGDGDFDGVTGAVNRWLDGLNLGGY